MSFLRTTFRSSIRRGAPLSTLRPLTSRPFSITLLRSEPQGYGDGKGDPRAENPQDQGSSNTTKHNAEHPGPEPPSEGQGTGAGPTKGGSSTQKTPEDAPAQSGGSRSKEAKETGESPTGGKIGGSKGGEQDKGRPSHTILNEKLPKRELSQEKQAEVEEHNKEFEKGHDRAPKAGG